MIHRRYKTSYAMWKDAERYVVPASSLIAKDPHLFTYGAYPIYLAEGNGARVRDVDGHWYTDFQSSLGPAILGIAYPAVDAAVMRQLHHGVLFSLLHPLQNDLAKIVCDLVPCAERVRIFKTGSDATTGAVRIARACTGRDMIVSCHFHGWHDWYYATTSMNRGIPASVRKDIIEFTYNDSEGLEKILRAHKGTVAAVIMEPVHLDPPRRGFLKQVQSLAHRHGALLIFDEVVTGFRFSVGGAQEYFGVTPDLACFAKAIANGLPLGIVAGKKHIMDNTRDVITSTTFSEDALAIAAAIATLKELRRRPVIAHIWRMGAEFQNGFNALATQYAIPVVCAGFPPRLELSFSDYRGRKRLEIKAYFLQESAKRGVLFGNAIFMNYAHTCSDIKKALRICEEIFRTLADAHLGKRLVLEGEPTQELW